MTAPSPLDDSLEILAPPEVPPGERVERLRDLSSEQIKSGIAAWLGWLFDGLDMHLYTLVAAPFVAELLGPVHRTADVGKYSSIIQAAFLVGWALGGGLFGRVGDRLGRSHALVLTILTYACFTGMSYFAQAWWHLMVFRFLAALGIGGEWAVGSSLLAETWPARWRPWIAATLQSAVNCGVLLAALTNALIGHLDHGRVVFLVGILPALLVLWIRSAVPETEQWTEAKLAAGAQEPRVIDLFRGSVRRVTILTLLVCALSLTAHWAFMFWSFQHLRKLPDVARWSPVAQGGLVSTAMVVLMVSAMVGNVLAGILARLISYRRAIALFFVVYFVVVIGAYGFDHSRAQLVWFWFTVLGICQGVFALFTMYLPPLFPTLLRTTGAGFCYNIGRIVAAIGTVFFGLIAPLEDYAASMVYASFLFLPAAAVALLMPEPESDRVVVTPVD